MRVRAMSPCPFRLYVDLVNESFWWLGAKLDHGHCGLNQEGEMKEKGEAVHPPNPLG